MLFQRGRRSLFTYKTIEKAEHGLSKKVENVITKKGYRRMTEEERNYRREQFKQYIQTTKRIKTKKKKQSKRNNLTSESSNNRQIVPQQTLTVDTLVSASATQVIHSIPSPHLFDNVPSMLSPEPSFPLQNSFQSEFSQSVMQAIIHQNGNDEGFPDEQNQHDSTEINEITMEESNEIEQLETMTDHSEVESTQS